MIIPKLFGLVGYIGIKHHLVLWNRWAIVRIVAEIYNKLMFKKVRPLEEGSIPHLNPMKWQMHMSGNTTVTTPNAQSKTVPTPIHASRLLAS
jgi:hypothetical protein